MAHAWAGYVVNNTLSSCSRNNFFTSNFEPWLEGRDALCGYSNCALYKEGPEYKKY